MRSDVLRKPSGIFSIFRVSMEARREGAPAGPPPCLKVRGRGWGSCSSEGSFVFTSLESEAAGYSVLA